MSEEERAERIRLVRDCVHRLYTSYIVYCEFDEDCGKLMRYLLDDFERRLGDMEPPWRAYDEEEREYWLYRDRDCPDPGTCDRAWRDMKRTIRYCIQRNLEEPIQLLRGGA
jgi:hypothetical protein